MKISGVPFMRARNAAGIGTYDDLRIAPGRSFRYSALAPESFTTLAHFTISVFTKAVSSGTH